MHGRTTAPTISITEFGADPSGRTDSTMAIIASARAAKKLDATVLVPAGTFRHRSFDLDGVQMEGLGEQSVLLAVNPNDGTIHLQGAAPALQSVRVEVRSSQRDSEKPNVAIFVDGATDFAIEGVQVEGGNTGGILNYGGQNGRIVRNIVQDTLADGIHNTHGARSIIIADNVVRRAGDDMIAIVSYNGEPLCRNILIENNDLADQAYGRGISVVGGQDVTIQGNKVSRTDCCAGIYLASERSWNTLSVRNVLVRGNVLTDNSGPSGQGAIMIFADNGSVSDVRLEDNTVERARHAAITLSGAVSQIAIINNRLIDPASGTITGDGPRAYCHENTGFAIPVCSERHAFAVTGASITYR